MSMSRVINVHFKSLAKMHKLFLLTGLAIEVLESILNVPFSFPICDLMSF